MAHFVYKNELNFFTEEVIDASISKHKELLLSPLNALSLTQPAEFLSLPGETCKNLREVSVDNVTIC